MTIVNPCTLGHKIRSEKRNPWGWKVCKVVSKKVLSSNFSFCWYTYEYQSRQVIGLVTGVWHQDFYRNNHCKVTEQHDRCTLSSPMKIKTLWVGYSIKHVIAIKWAQNCLSLMIITIFRLHVLGQGNSLCHWLFRCFGSWVKSSGGTNNIWTKDFFLCPKMCQPNNFRRTHQPEWM